MIQPGNEGIVHHIVLYGCTGDIDDDNHGVAWDCISNVMPDQHKCLTVLFLWAVGGNVSLNISPNFGIFHQH